MSCKCCCTHGHTAIQEKRNSLLKDYWRIILSALLLFGGLILNATDTTFFKGEYVPFIWYLLAYLPVGLPVMREAWESILQKDVFSEFTLMSIATLGAFYIGEYPEGVAVMLFYSLGELFQDKAVDKAKRNISALLDVRPETVWHQEAGFVGRFPADGFFLGIRIIGQYVTHQLEGNPVFRDDVSLGAPQVLRRDTYLFQRF